MKMKKNYVENNLTLFYIGWMFLVYPLFTKGNYFNITEIKWKMLCVVTGLFLLLWGCARVTEGKWLEKSSFRLGFDVFAVLILISSLFSPYTNTAWIGGSSRYTGAVFMLLMIGAALFIGNSYITEHIPKLMYVVALGGALISLWAVLNFVGVDPFYMHEGMVKEQYRVFMSGIGNVVFLGSFFALFIPIMFGQFLEAEKKRKAGIYGIGLFMGTAGLGVSGNDSGVIAVIIVLFLLVPLFVRDRKEVLRYTAGIGIVMLAGIIVEFAARYSVYESEVFDNVLSIAFDLSGFKIGLIACIVVFAIVFFMRTKFSATIFKLVYYLVVVAGIIFVICTQEQLQSLLTFGERWGTSRGYVWIKAVEIFMHEPFLRKLFGNGADSFGGLLIKYIGSDIGANGYRFDNVHCEYLQYLLSYGLLGLGAYLYTVGRILLGLVQNREHSGCIAVAAGICGYMIQAVVGLNQVFTTPLLFILCGIGMVLGKKCPGEKGRQISLKKKRV